MNTSHYSANVNALYSYVTVNYCNVTSYRCHLGLFNAYVSDAVYILQLQVETVNIYLIYIYVINYEINDLRGEKLHLDF